jgi:hypothetical protein
MRCLTAKKEGTDNTQVRVASVWSTQTLYEHIKSKEVFSRVSFEGLKIFVRLKCIFAHTSIDLLVGSATEQAVINIWRYT